MGGTTLAWFAFLGMTTYNWERDPANRGTLPPPRLYFGTAVLFTALGLLARPAPQLAATMGWALVLGEVVAAPANKPAAVAAKLTRTSGGTAQPDSGAGGPPARRHAA